MTERSNRAIAKLGDLAPATNDDQNIRPIRPPHADVAAGFSLSAASFEASAFDLRRTGRRTNRQAWTNKPIDVPRADRLLNFAAVTCRALQPSPKMPRRGLEVRPWPPPRLPDLPGIATEA
nr:hypothetical protein KS05_24290 [Rhizobium brockwellii]